MKLTHCLRALLTVAFVVGVLSLTHAGQKGVVVSPNAGTAKVEPGAGKIVPTKIVPSQPKSGGTEIVPRGKAGEVDTGGFVPLKVDKKRKVEITTVKFNGLTPTIYGTP